MKDKYPDCEIKSNPDYTEDQNKRLKKYHEEMRRRGFLYDPGSDTYFYHMPEEKVLINLEKIERFTCWECDQVYCCEYSFDPYNTGNDCLRWK